MRKIISINVDAFVKVNKYQAEVISAQWEGTYFIADLSFLVSDSVHAPQHAFRKIDRIGIACPGTRLPNGTFNLMADLGGGVVLHLISTRTAHLTIDVETSSSA